MVARKNKPVYSQKRVKDFLLFLITFALFIICLFFLNNLFIRNKNSSESINNQTVNNDTLNNKFNEVADTEILAEGEGLEVVKTHCTSCHSAKLIVQNRATREGWLSMIRWMQQTQNLWDLGANEEIILDYLSTHYPPEEKGRRENLKDIQWYELK